jgi:hypothetical protein
MRALVVALTVLLSSSAAFGQTWVVAAGSVVRVRAEHPFQSVVLESHAPEGQVRWSATAPTDFAGWIEQPLSVAWASFDSGNANRDAVIRERVRSYRYPLVHVVPESYSRVVTTADGGVYADMTARVYVAGRMQRAVAKVQLRPEGPQELLLQTRAALRMSDFLIEAPALLFLAADDEVIVELELRLRAAAISGP